MSPLFRQISYYKDVAPFSFPMAGFAPAGAPRGTWPAAGGGAGRTGRAGEPLVHDGFTVAWQAPLGAATRPDGLLVAGDRVVVNGIRQRGFWADDAGERTHLRRHGERNLRAKTPLSADAEAESKNVDTKLLTVVGGRSRPNTWGRRRAIEFGVKSMHLGKIVAAPGEETAALPHGLKLTAAGVPSGLVFNGP